MSKKNMQFKTNKTPFCKICFDFKRPEEEYTSHWVKDKPGPEGKVICPHLLNMECRYCHEKGHLLSNCPILKQNKERKQKTHKKQSGTFILSENTQQKVMMPPSLELLQQKLNVDILPKIPSTLPPLPPLPPPPPALTLKSKDIVEDKPTKTTYADKCKVNNNIKIKVNAKDNDEIQINKTKIITTKKKALQNKKKINWADMVDSDNETDDEDDINNYWLIE